MERLGVLLLDLGLGASALGVASLLASRRVSRRRTALLLGGGAALVLAAAALPVRERRSNRGPARIDDFVPVFQFDEFHEIEIEAPPERVYRAVREVTAGEIPLFEALTWIRSPRLPWREAEASILAAPADRPILDVATSSGFVWLALDLSRQRPHPPHVAARRQGPGRGRTVITPVGTAISFLSLPPRRSRMKV